MIFAMFLSVLFLLSYVAYHMTNDPTRYTGTGTMRTVYDPKGHLGDPSTIENTVIAYEPLRMLALRVSKMPTGFPFPNAIKAMWTVIYFEPTTGGTTRVREVSMGFGSDEESEKMREFFDRGNTATMTALQRRFAAPGH